MDFFKQHNVNLLISLDGPKHIQDINRMSKNNKSIFELVDYKVKLAKENNINLLVVSTFNEDSIIHIYDTYLYHMENNNYFNFLFDVKYSNYISQIQEIEKEFKKIAIDFASRSKEKQKLWTTINEPFKNYNNNLHYSFAINHKKIRVKTHLNSYREFAEWDSQKQNYIITSEDLSTQDLIDGKFCVPKYSYCTNCWVNNGYRPDTTVNDFSIYCLLLKEVYMELERKGFTINDFTN